LVFCIDPCRTQLAMSRRIKVRHICVAAVSFSETYLVAASNGSGLWGLRLLMERLPRWGLLLSVGRTGRAGHASSSVRGSSLGSFVACMNLIAPPLIKMDELISSGVYLSLVRPSYS
jgi:hypothetical protein